MRAMDGCPGLTSLRCRPHLRGYGMAAIEQDACLSEPARMGVGGATRWSGYFDARARSGTCGSNGFSQRRISRFPGSSAPAPYPVAKANQPVSGWNDAIPDPAMTVAAIDRLVHHSAIFELNVESSRHKASDKQSVHADRAA